VRIITLCLSSGLGGLELYALRSALALAASESVEIITAPAGKFRDKAISSGLHHRAMQPWFRPFPLLSAIRLARLIDDSKTDVVHMHWGKDLPLASLAIKLSRRKPALVYTRQMQITRMKTDVYHQFLYREMSMMLAITEQLRQRCANMLGKNFSDKVKTLYYGVEKPSTAPTSAEIIEQRAKLNIPQDCFLVGLFGRLEDQKGQHLLIRAVARAKAEGKIIRALIVGHEMEPGYRNTLTSLAKDLDVFEQIAFLDFVDKPQAIMQLCDCVVLATYMETFGLVLPEAMRAGIAVIGSNAGGVPEIIEHGRTGLLFEARNAEDLKVQILKLYSDRNLLHKLATQGMQKADSEFNGDMHFARLLAIFQKLIPAKA
jgi:glycosyltransferase involved in cell wall biosynthesis